MATKKEWIKLDENDYILESLFEKQLNEIIDFQCQEDPSIDIGETICNEKPYCKYDTTNNQCKHLFEYLQNNSDNNYSTIENCFHKKR